MLGLHRHKMRIPVSKSTKMYSFRADEVMLFKSTF